MMLTDELGHLLLGERTISQLTRNRSDPDDIAFSVVGLSLDAEGDPRFVRLVSAAEELSETGRRSQEHDEHTARSRV